MICLPFKLRFLPAKMSLQNLDSCITPPNFKKFPSASLAHDLPGSPPPPVVTTGTILISHSEVGVLFI